MPNRNICQEGIFLQVNRHPPPQMQKYAPMKTRIAEFRKKADMSQEDLAAEVGVQQPQISKWENGGRDITLSQLETIAKILKTTVPELISRPTLPPQKDVSILGMVMENMVMVAKEQRKNPQLIEGVLNLVMETYSIALEANKRGENLTPKTMAAMIATKMAS